MPLWRIVNSIWNKGKSAINPVLNGPETLSSASDKANIFQITLIMRTQVTNLPALLSRITLKLHNIPLAPKLAENVISDLFCQNCVIIIF